MLAFFAIRGTNLLITFLVGLGLLFTPLFSQGQGAPGDATPEDHLVPRVPGSPTAAALERYALMPVNEASGTPTIDLPLLEAKSGSLSLPLSLSYHASGIRVDDEASWVGLGWSLNAGGIITRVVRGRADESSNGFMSNYNRLPDVTTLEDAKDYDFLRSVANQQDDYEADLFTYSFPGGNGTFMFGNDGAFHTLPYQPMQIAFTRRGATSDFVLVDNAGISYTFAEQEYTTSNRKGPNGPTNCSAWYLTQILSADRVDTIRLIYNRHNISYRSNYYQSSSVLQGPDEGMICGSGGNPTTPAGITTSSSNNSVQAARLREIVFQQGRIVFSAQTTRADILSDTRLTTISLLPKGQAQPIRTVTLTHSYFNDDLPIADVAAKSAYLRLRLDAVQITGNGQQLPPHRFTYSAIRLPTRGTGPRDHWGYANDAYSTSPSVDAPPALIPRTRVPIVSGGTVQVGNANREPNPTYTQAGLLQRITYPSGGHVTYTYEANIAPAPVLMPAPQESYYQEATGTGHNTAVRKTETINTGNHVKNVTGMIAVRRYNDPTHNYLHNAGGTITITDITNNNRVVIFHHNVTGAKNGVTSGDPFTVYPASGLPELAANRTYEIMTEGRGEDYDANVNLFWEKAPAQYQTIEKPLGGVRAKTMRSYTAEGIVAQVRQYTYTKPNSSASSGYSLSPFAPTYIYDQTMRRGTTSHMGQCDISGCRYIIISSQPVGELNSGQSVGYAYVTVLDSVTSTGSYGQIVSQYSTQQLQGNIYKPYPPAVDLSWKRGNLLRRWTYKGNDQQQFVLVDQLLNDYTNTNTVEINGFRAIPDVSYSGCTNLSIPSNSSAPQYAQRFAFTTTYAIGQWHYLSRTRRYQYAPGTDTTQYLLTTTTYRYDNQRHAQPTAITTGHSDGSRTVVYARYPADYDPTPAVTPEATAIQEMARRQMNAVPIERWTTRHTPTATQVLQAQLNLPTWVNQGVALYRSLQWESATSLPASQFTVSYLVNGQLVTDSRYREKTVVDFFDDRYNVLQQRQVGAPPVAYVWGYDQNHLIAQIQNAAYAQVAFTSFEANSPGGWVYQQANQVPYAFTGTQGYGLGGSATVRRTGLPAGTYELSLWAHGTGTPQVSGASQQQRQEVAVAGDWHQHRYQLTLPANATVEVSTPGYIWIDEVRLHPVGAQMTSYTHEPLVGLSSVTDVNGQPTRYEYDGLGRLKLVRDLQGNIRQQQQYHYKAQ